MSKNGKETVNYKNYGEKNERTNKKMKKTYELNHDATTMTTLSRKKGISESGNAPCPCIWINEDRTVIKLMAAIFLS